MPKIAQKALRGALSGPGPKSTPVNGGRDRNPPPPRGPNDQKNLIPIEIFDPDRNFGSRSKISISTSRFPPQKIGPRWVARSKISFSLEIFNPDRNLEFFLIFGPSGHKNERKNPVAKSSDKSRRLKIKAAKNPFPEAILGCPRKYCGERPQSNESYERESP